MNRTYFLDIVLPGVYNSPEGAHSHQLAVLLAAHAMALLFEPTSSDESIAENGFQAIDYHDTAYACLVAGSFLTDITSASLITLHLLGSFLLNAKDRRLADGVFSLFGLAIRLAVLAGYHRGEQFHELIKLTSVDTPRSGSRFSPDEHNVRRRIWFELLAAERVNVSPALLERC